MSSADRYPLAVATLARLRGERSDAGGLTDFRLGPAVLRAPARVQRAPAARDASGAGDEAGDDVEDLLGELVDFVLVDADESPSRHPEVHLRFKAAVFGGLHLRLEQTGAGLAATFFVSDHDARRLVGDAIEALLVRLRERGFVVARHAVEVGSLSDPDAPSR